jgi:glycolate oxidase
VKSRILEELAGIVGEENVHSGPVECLSYSRDMSVHRGVPDAVVFARTTEQVSRIMALASREKIPVTPRGAGTSVTGAVLPVRGGVLLDLHLMNRILEISKSDFYARVEPGVLCMQLNRALSPLGLMFPPNPGSELIATIGGMVSTNASGHRAVKYGTTQDYLKRLTVVLVDGTVIRTGSAAPKSALGYDLTHLFCGAEGTLGVITEITVRIEPKPLYSAVASAVFDDLNEAGDAVTEISTSGIRLASCEIMDSRSIRVVEEALGRPVSGIAALLIMEADGTTESVGREMALVREICERHNVREFEWTDDPQRREEMMLARGRLVPTLSRIKPFHRLIPIAEDLGVPSTRIPETIRRAQEIAERYDVIIATFGHIGDGNVHTTFVADVRSREQWERLKPAAEELLRTAMEMNGTLSAEHGTGLTRAPHIGWQLGEAMEVMRKIKRVLDPDNLLNPGKMALDGDGNNIYDHFAFAPLIERPEGIVSLGESVDNEILACIHCGFCRLGCPTFHVTHRESRDARGRNALAYYLMSGTLEPSEELAQAFYTCTTCQACTVYCPAQIKVDQIVIGLRRKLSEAGFVPQGLAGMASAVAATGNVYGSAPAERIDVYPRELKERIRRGELKPTAPVLLFMGCVPSYLDMKMVPSLIRALDAAEVDYTVLGEDEICCGFPLYLIGSEALESHAQELIRRIAATGARELVTPCAGCYKAFRKVYAHLDGLQVEAYHSVHYLWKLIEEGRISLTRPLGKRVTYHDPCDLGRGFGIYEEPRDILASVPGIEYAEMSLNRERARCCGGGGGVQGNAPELAVQMAERRVRDALEVGAEVIVSGCAACKDNLRKGARRIPRKERGKLRVMDITEIVLGAMGL